MNALITTILTMGVICVGSLIAMWSYLTITYNKKLNEKDALIKRKNEIIEDCNTTISDLRLERSEKDRIYAEANKRKQSIIANDSRDTFNNANGVLKQQGSKRSKSHD